MAMLFRVFPPAERIRASSILVVPTALAPAIGPVLGGVLVDTLSWRWVFLVNLPIGVFAFAFGAVFLRDVELPPAGRFDGPGFVLSGVGFAALMYGVSEGPQRGWDDPFILTTITVGVVLLAALVVTQLRTPEPLLNLRLFGDRLFRSATAAVFLATAAFLGLLYLVALFFQDGLGLSALQSGLSTFPEALGVMAGAQLATRLLYPRLGPRRLMVGGLTLVALMMVALTTIHDRDQLWLTRALMFGLGFAMSPNFVSTQAAAFARVSAADTGRASTTFNALRQLGGAVGVSVLTSTISAVGVTHRVGGTTAPNLRAYHVAFLVAAGLAVVAALIALTVHDADADSTRPGWARAPDELATSSR
jgi:EmrB/QacA subfamily drug resistance transporter